jgi:two-component system NtrC family sensor kinase
MQTNFDESLSADKEGIGKINVVSQDLGRVLLNLFNNAFYSVNEKKKAIGNALLSDGKDYEPKISVSTKKLNGKVEIRVKDNGRGIPKKALDKIFQPFFTTKPAGEGTGLGLSISYDIITKEHGGTLQANAKEGEYAEFIIQLPV